MTIDELAPPTEAAPEAVERTPQTHQFSVQKTENPGPPLRALAMVLIAVGIVFAGLGALDFAGREPAEPAPVVEAPVVAQEKEPVKAAPVPTPAQIKAVNVRVLNNSGISGLAGKTAKQLTAEGWKVVETGNYSDTSMKRTVAYYGANEAEKRAALEIADELGIAAEKKTPDVSNLGTGVIVVMVD